MNWIVILTSQRSAGLVITRVYTFLLAGKVIWVYAVRHIEKRSITYYKKKKFEDKKKSKNGFSTYYKKNSLNGLYT